MLITRGIFVYLNRTLVLVLNRLLPFILPCLLLMLSDSHGELYRIRDAGMERSFEPALNEIAVTRGSQRRIITGIPAVADFQALRQEVQRRLRDQGEVIEPVLYEIIKGRRHGVPRLLTREILVEADPGFDVTALTGQGAIRVRPAPGLPGAWIAEAAYPVEALDLAERMRNVQGVLNAQPLLARKMTKKMIPNDTLFTNQWHLLNTGQFGGTAGSDVRITNVWDTRRGTNIVIGIIDDGLQTGHPDLAPNVNTNIDWDFNYSDPNPNPGFSDDNHGTACAGLAAARGNNGLGVSGTAPEAQLVGLRLLSLEITDSDEADALNWSNNIIHIKSNSWGPDDDGSTLEGPGLLSAAALANACQLGRDGRGVLLFWSGGNGGAYDDDSNKDGYANSIYTIAVGATDKDGNQTSYSEAGANLVICAPGGDVAGVGIWTTDRTGSAGYSSGDYAGDFAGTSAACPIAAGVGALLLEANPLLGWRDVQEILIRSATRNDPANSWWRANAAGIWFNRNYGGGMINASGAVTMASTWTNLGPQISISTNQAGLSIPIPDDDPNGVTNSFQVDSDMRVEHAVVTLSINHSYRGDLNVELISPGNTTSYLARTHGDSNANYSAWSFMTVHNWGETASGTWQVRVSDRNPVDAGTLEFAGLTLYGSTQDCLTYHESSNPAYITIQDNTVADPYPSSIMVLGFTQTISKVRVALHGFTHSYAGDVDALLVGPGGHEIYLMAGAGTNGAASDATIIFDAYATNYLPQAGDVLSGTYRPSLYIVSDSLNSPAPPGPYTNDTLADFAGTSPNGLWSLYIQDWVGGDDGELAGGWSLYLDLDCGQDSDEDGMRDSWEFRVFGNLGSADATSDWDEDRVSDADEFRAGTGARDPQSYLRFETTSTTETGILPVITWQGVTGKLYSIARSSNLLEEAFSVIASNIQGVVPLNVHTDTVPITGFRAYRIEVEP